ncbi:MAG: type VI secretion system tube protein Hcp [Planctomyces sp.]|nr:type VI secretion system tube protein Hcp [Planctomyces sp.]
MAGFIKFDDVDGESRDKGHDKWSDVIVFSQNFHRQVQVGARAHHMISDPVRVVKAVDAASAILLEKMSTNHIFPKVEIDCTRSYTGEGRKGFLKVRLLRCMVHGFQLTGPTQSDDVPTEELTLGFESIEFEYILAGPDGKQEGAFTTLIDYDSAR